MEVEYDDFKDIVNRAKHGVPLAFGAAVLQHLLKTAPKSKLAAGAKNKLKTVVL